MRKIAMLSLATVALIGAGGVAYAQADREIDRVPPMTRAEVEQRSTQAFARMDANDDGVLNQADREARREAGQREAFDRIDSDNSGGISFAEFAALREQRGEARAERGPGLDDRQFGRRGPGRQGDRRGPGGPDLGRAADTNNDGAVSQAEFAGAALTQFDRVDANKDGTIGADERPGPRRMRAMRRHRDAG